LYKVTPEVYQVYTNKNPISSSFLKVTENYVGISERARKKTGKTIRLVKNIIHNRIRRQKQLGGGEGEQNLPEYFFTCPSMTNLVGKIHVKNC